MFKKTATALVLGLVLASSAVAQLADTGQVNNEYSRTDGSIIAWATQVIATTRGP